MKFQSLFVSIFLFCVLFTGLSGLAYSDEALTIFKRGQQLLEEKKYEAAKQEYEKALRLKLNVLGQTICYWQLGVCTKWMNDEEGEVTYLKRFLELVSQTKGSDTWNQFDFPQKIEYAKARVSGRKIKDVETHFNAGEDLVRKRKYREAKVEFENALIANPGPSDLGKIFIIWDLFLIHRELKEVEGQTRYAKELIQMAKKCLGNKDYEKFVKPKVANASEFLDRIEMEPEYSQTYALLIRGDVSQAINKAKNVYDKGKSAETRALAAFLLGECYFDSGDLLQAQKYFKEFLKNRPEGTNKKYAEYMVAYLENP